MTTSWWETSAPTGNACVCHAVKFAKQRGDTSWGLAYVVKCKRINMAWYGHGGEGRAINQITGNSHSTRWPMTTEDVASITALVDAMNAGSCPTTTLSSGAVAPENTFYSGKIAESYDPVRDGYPPSV